MKRLKKRVLFVLGHLGGIYSGSNDFGFLSLREIYWRVGAGEQYSTSNIQHSINNQRFNTQLTNKVKRRERGFGYAQSSVRAALGELVGDGLVVKVTRGGRASYRLTTSGRDVLFLDWPRFGRESKVWDRGWRVVVLDSKRLTRAQVKWLRVRLKQMGFGMLARGVWVTPKSVSEDIKRLLIDKRMTGGVTVLVTRRFVVGDDRDFARRVWGVDKVGDEYKSVITLVSKLIRGVRSAKRIDHKLKGEILSVFDRWYGLMGADPGLPKALLPEDWGFEEARDLFGKLCESVVELEREEV